MNEANLVKDVLCPCCNQKNEPYSFECITLFNAQVKLGLNKCNNCGLHYISPRLNESGLSILYNKGYLDKTVSGKYNTAPLVSQKEYLKFAGYAAKYLNDNSKILDVGCGVGNLLEMLNKSAKKYVLEGVEISKTAGTAAQEKGYTVHIGTLQEAPYLEESFDCIIMLYVMEHVDDPRSILIKINSLLKPGGFLMLAVPNYRYLQIAFDNLFSRFVFRKRLTLHPEEHLQNFTPRTLEKMVGKERLEIIERNIAQPLAIGSSLVRLAKSIAFGICYIFYKLGYNIGGIHLIARKPMSPRE